MLTFLKSWRCIFVSCFRNFVPPHGRIEKKKKYDMPTYSRLLKLKSQIEILQVAKKILDKFVKNCKSQDKKNNYSKVVINQKKKKKKRINLNKLKITNSYGIA